VVFIFNLGFKCSAVSLLDFDLDVHGLEFHVVNVRNARVKQFCFEVPGSIGSQISLQFVEMAFDIFD